MPLRWERTRTRAPPRRCPRTVRPGLPPPGTCRSPGTRGAARARPAHMVGSALKELACGRLWPGRHSERRRRAGADRPEKHRRATVAACAAEPSAWCSCPLWPPPDSRAENHPHRTPTPIESQAADRRLRLGIRQGMTVAPVTRRLAGSDDGRQWFVRRVRRQRARRPHVDSRACRSDDKDCCFPFAPGRQRRCRAAREDAGMWRRGDGR